MSVASKLARAVTKKLTKNITKDTPVEKESIPVRPVNQSNLEKVFSPISNRY